MRQIILFLFAFIFISCQMPVQAKYWKLIEPSQTNSNNVFYFGCPSDRNEAKDILNLLDQTESAWNAHRVEDLLQYYSQNFRTKDGTDLDKIRFNLGEFWFYYPNSKISSIPVSVYACGNHATVSIIEQTDASKRAESGDTTHFKAWIRGITTLKKIGNNWKVENEDIITETIWKYQGVEAADAINKGYLKLIVPNKVISGENYIAQLQHNLPKNIKALAFIDKSLLGEFDDEIDELEEDEEFIKAERKRMTEISRALTGPEQMGLRRLFNANSSGQGELVTAHIELIVFPNLEDPTQFHSGGIISISQRVEPYEKAVKEEIVEIKEKSAKDEYLEKAQKN